MGYSSDICRSFFIDPPAESEVSFLRPLKTLLQRIGLLSPARPVVNRNQKLYAEKLKVWDIVLDAQTAAAAAFKPNGSAASVDLAARRVIDDAGYGYGFTHRLGHGIGIKGMPSTNTI